MSNKLTLQNHNKRISENNISLETILETINNLPEAGGATVKEYAKDGLIALFDARDEIDANGRWNSQIGNDYWSVTYTDSSTTSLAQLKTDDAIVTDGTVSIRNNVDYYKDGYTIELVGATSGENEYGVNFFCFDKALSAHININRYSVGIFSPQYGTATDGMRGCEYLIKGLNDGKRHTMALHLQKRQGNRNNTGGTVELLYSVDGSPWYLYDYYINGGGTYKSNYCTLLSYYSTTASGRAPAGSEVSAIRVYNRKLSRSELMNNYYCDIENYNVIE